MEKKISHVFSFRSGAIRKSNICYVSCSHDETTEKGLPNSTFITVFDQKWGALSVNWNANSICAALLPKEQMVAISEDGKAQINGSGETFEEQIGRGEDHPEKRGPLSEVRNIAGKAFACGMDRQVYRRVAAHSWICIDQDMRQAPAVMDVFGFESIHGFSENDLYAVGWHGEIWHFDGSRWDRIESPTDLLLNKVFCAQDGNVYICGHQGMLIRGRGSAWQVIEHGDTQADLWDLQGFNGKLYLSSMRMLFALEEDRLKPVDTGDEIPATCYHLDAADGIMWSIGAKDILQFDGQTWTRIQ